MYPVPSEIYETLHIMAFESPHIPQEDAERSVHSGTVVRVRVQCSVEMPQQTSPPPCSPDQNSKEYVIWNEVSETNLSKNKRTLNKKPFLHGVYSM